MALQYCNAYLTCENTRKRDGTGSLIYFYSSYFNADKHPYVVLSSVVSHEIDRLEALQVRVRNCFLN